MRVLAVSNLYPPRALGGYERSAQELCEGLRSRGHEVLVLTSPAEQAVQEVDVDRSLSMLAYLDPQPVDPAIKLLTDHRCMASQRDNTLVLLDRVRSFRPDVVLFFNLIGIGGLALLDLMRMSGVPWVWNLGDRVPNAMLEGTLESVRAIYGEKRLFAGGRVSLVSEVLRHEVEGGGIVLPEQTRVIPRGFRFAQAPPRRRRSQRATRFLSAGTLGEDKGTGLLINAVALLAGEGRRDLELRIVGPGDVAGYRAQVRELGLEELVRIEGELDRDGLAEQYRWSDLFLFPGREREPFGRVPFEALAHGSVPIVATATAASEWLLDGVDCVKVNRDAESFATAMGRAVGGQYELARMAEAGERLLRGAVSFERTIDAHEQQLAEAARPFVPLPPDIGERALMRDHEALLAVYTAAERLASGGGHSDLSSASGIVGGDH